MATIGCKDFPNYLEPLMEGDRHPDALAHLRDCPRCRSLIEDLKAIQATAQEWGRTESEPPAYLWNSLRAQLVQEGLIHQQGKQRGWLTGWLPSVPRPALAGAYLAAVIAVAFGLSGPVNQRINRARWLEGTQNSTMPLRAQFASAQMNATPLSLPDSIPTVTASLQIIWRLLTTTSFCVKKASTKNPKMNWRAIISLRPINRKRICLPS